MANPKLLTELTIDSSRDTFGWNASLTADISSANYGSILETLGNLEDQLQAVDVNFYCTISSLGYITIGNSNASWTAWWAGTDSDLQTLLGFAGTESVTGSGPWTLTGSKRHQSAFYSPVLVLWRGTRRRMPRRHEPTTDGSATVYGSTTAHKYRSLLFSPLYEGQVEEDQAATLSDGAGGTLDWTDITFSDFWRDTNAKQFRFYEDGSDGTVADPGTEGTDYWTCIREGQEIEPAPLDGDDLTWWSVEMDVHVIGG